MATEVADVTEPIPVSAPARAVAPARASRLALGIGVAGFAALLCAGGTVVYTSSHKSASLEKPATSVVASAPTPKLAPPPASPATAPDPASTMFSTAPKPVQASTVASGRTSNSAATLPDFSLPAFDWNPPPPPELPPVDWSSLMGQVAAANTAGQAGAIVGPIAGTAGTVFAGATSLLGNLILASAYNGNGMTKGVDPITALLSVIGAPVANAAAPNAFAALQSMPPLALPPPPDLTNPLGLPPPPPAIGLPPPPDLLNPLGLPPPPPPIGLPPPPNLLNPLGLHLWPFF